MTSAKVEKASIEDVFSQLDQHLELLFYPSSGRNIGNIFNLPYDIFVFADKSPQTEYSRIQYFREISRSIGDCQIQSRDSDNVFFKRKSKLGLFVFDDNNVVLKSIQDTGGEISGFIGIRDGCVEGGNDECVNDIPFLSKVLYLVPQNGMRYFTDHSYLLSNMHPRSNHFDDDPRNEVIFKGICFSHVGVCDKRLSSSPLGPMHEFLVTHHSPSVRQWSGSTLRVTFEHDTIADHLAELDGVYVSTRCRELFQTAEADASPDILGAPDYFFMPSLQPGWSTRESITSLLKLCEREEWKIVGTTAFGENHHLDMIEVLESWEGKYPAWVRIFHFDQGDFVDIDHLFQRIE